MKGKWLYGAGVMILLGMVALTGCGKKGSPLQASSDSGMILTLISASAYTSGDGFAGTNDSTTTPQGFTWGSGITSWDTLARVRFARFFTGNKRSVKIDSITAGKTKAWVTITHNISGGFYDNSSFPYDPYQTYIRPLNDQWVRHVYLEKNSAGVWRVMKLSPIDAQTVNSPYPITILSVVVDAQPSGAHYVFTRADTLLAREDLPTFLPGDSVTVTVSVSVQGDSSWAFLHRWGRPWLWHIRKPFYRTSLTTFQRTWVIAQEDSVYATPAIRHSAVDLIGMKALFGDANQQYNAHAWGLLYVVKNTEDAYPE